MSSVIILQGTTDSFSLQNLATLPDLLMSANRRFFLASKYKDKSVFLTGCSQMFEQKKKKRLHTTLSMKTYWLCFSQLHVLPEAKWGKQNCSVSRVRSHREERQTTLIPTKKLGRCAQHKFKDKQEKGKEILLLFSPSVLHSTPPFSESDVEKAF